MPPVLAHEQDELAAVADRLPAGLAQPVPVVPHIALELVVNPARSAGTVSTGVRREDGARVWAGCVWCGEVPIVHVLPGEVAARAGIWGEGVSCGGSSRLDGLDGSGEGSRDRVGDGAGGGEGMPETLSDKM